MIASATALNDTQPKTCISQDTMSRMLDCPKLPDSSFFTANLPKNVNFQLSEDEWNRIKPIPTQPTKFQSSWTYVLAHYMLKSNPFCTFDFKRHFIPIPKSRKRKFAYILTASGFCIFQHCTFNVSMKKDDFEKRIVNVIYSGSVRHAAGERHARFIKGEERKAMPKSFHKGSDKPSAVYQEKKADLPTDALASGNRTGCGIQPTIKKIASEGRQLSQMDKDMFKLLQKIRLHLTEKQSSCEFPPNSIEGFVHMICQFPLIVHMWTEDQVRLWHERCGNDISYINATGTIIANYSGKRVLYYAFVVRHPCKGNPSVPVAEMITTDQRACNIRMFLGNFRRDECKTFTGQITSQRQLNCDYSRAILLAVLREFNNENLCDFFERAFRILNKFGLEKDFTLTIPHVGCSHFMHIVHRKIKAIERAQPHLKNDEKAPSGLINDIWYHFNMYSMSLLVNARTLYEFLQIHKDVTICLLSKKQTKLLLFSYNRVNGRVRNMNKDRRVDLSNFQTDSNNMEQEKDEIAILRLNVNPFDTFF